MLIDGHDEVYFFDRDHNIFKVKGLIFPYRKDLNRHLRDTLLDGVSICYFICKLMILKYFHLGNGY